MWEGVNGYGDFFGDKTYMASGMRRGSADTDDATGGTMYQWNNGFVTPYMTPGNMPTPMQARCVRDPNGTIIMPSAGAAS